MKENIPLDLPDTAGNPNNGSMLFLTDAHEQLLEQLAYSAQFNGGIQVVEGEAGTGKTTLAHILCRDYLAQAETLAYVSVEVAGGAATLQQAALALGLTVGDEDQPPGELIVALRHYVQGLQARSEIAILIIDEAQQLDQRTLSAFASLLQGATESGFGLHLVLWSEPGLVEKLDQLELVDIPVHDFRVPLLSLEETEDFLQASSQHGQREAEDIERVWVESGGRIGRIAELAAEQPGEVASGSEAPQTPLSSRWSVAGIPPAHMGALAVLIIVLGLALVMREPDDVAPSDGDSSGRVVATLDVADPGASSAVARKGVISRETFELEPVVNDDELRQAIYGGGWTQPDGAQVDAGSSAENDENEEPSAQGQEPSAQGQEPPAENAAETSSGHPRDASPGTKEPETTTSATGVGHQTAADGSKPAGASTYLDEAETARYDAKALLALDPESYSLQVMAASSAGSLEGFREQQSNRDQLFLYRTQRQGKPWYILLAGQYPTKTVASQAIRQLPAAQRTGGPWPRKLETVQRQIGEDRAR